MQEEGDAACGDSGASGHCKQHTTPLVRVGAFITAVWCTCSVGCCAPVVHQSLFRRLWRCAPACIDFAASSVTEQCFEKATRGLPSAGVSEVFKVAFKQYHTLAGPAAQPTLYFKPYGPLFDASSMDACVEGARLVTPGTWSYSVALGNATAQTGSKIGKAGRIAVPQLPWTDSVSCDSDWESLRVCLLRHI